jgi:hypothetical protein
LRERRRFRQNKKGCLSPLERRDCVIEEGVIAVVPPSSVARAVPWCGWRSSDGRRNDMQAMAKGVHLSPLVCATESAEEGAMPWFSPPSSPPRRRVCPAEGTARWVSRRGSRPRQRRGLIDRGDAFPRKRGALPPSCVRRRSHGDAPPTTGAVRAPFGHGGCQRRCWQAAHESGSASDGVLARTNDAATQRRPPAASGCGRHDADTAQATRWPFGRRRRFFTYHSS